jgi:tRNA pseudouridine55 synthase
MSFEVKSIEEFQTGKIIPINKPYQWTSFDVVKKVKNLIGKKLKLAIEIKLKNFKVGHAGTLDPLAEGMLIVCTGKATKTINELMADEKEYVATVELGKTTPSYDLETEYDQEYPYEHITKELVEKELEKFIGEQNQIPPVYSAKNVNGKRAYEYARKGEELVLKSNKIVITEIELLEFTLPNIVLRIVCGKGTYIRSLAHDLGKELECGGHLTKLIRTRIGDYKIESALTIQEIEKILTTL